MMNMILFINKNEHRGENIAMKNKIKDIYKSTR